MKRLFALVFALLVGLVLLNVPAFAAGPTAVSDEVTPVPVRDSLVVKCPQVADAGEKVLVKVYTRLTGQPAPKSEVWAVRWGPNVSPVPAADAISTGCWRSPSRRRGRSQPRRFAIHPSRPR